MSLKGAVAAARTARVRQVGRAEGRQLRGKRPASGWMSGSRPTGARLRCGPPPASPSTALERLRGAEVEAACGARGAQCASGRITGLHRDQLPGQGAIAGAIGPAVPTWNGTAPRASGPGAVGAAWPATMRRASPREAAVEVGARFMRPFILAIGARAMAQRDGGSCVCLWLVVWRGVELA
jgi:hypothetical protein